MRSDRIARLLPDVFQAALGDPASGGFERDRRMAGLLDAMEELHAPVEATLDQLADHLHPLLARPQLIRYLAGWVDLDRLDDPADAVPMPGPLPPERLRMLVSAAGHLSRGRGTVTGLARFLETATGVEGLVIEEDVTGDERTPRDFHLRVVAPATAEPHRAVLDRLIRAEKPAYLTYELAFAEATEPTGPPMGDPTHAGV